MTPPSATPTPEPKPRPDQLWQQAHDKFPDDRAALRIEYVRLMREHGHLQPTLDPRPKSVREFFGCDDEGTQR